MSVILAMGGFAAAMSASPGPVNILALTSGLNHGMGRTIPFVTGATIGFTLLLALIGLGFSSIVEGHLIALKFLKYLGSVYILTIAYKLIRASGNIDIEVSSKPSFVKGFALQWLNPKAWVACLAGISAFTTVGDFGSLLLFCSIYFVICFIAIFGWAALGHISEILVNNTRRMRFFNCCMGGLLACTAIYLFFSDVKV
ncbi:LysE family translocator [Curvivirga sp.]|uniref:LysE family translocator n=1 Tax=Curvivirga sp. TaxID=2856848 RepID=UPI003B599D3C